MTQATEETSDTAPETAAGTAPETGAGAGSGQGDPNLTGKQAGDQLEEQLFRLTGEWESLGSELEALLREAESSGWTAGVDEIRSVIATLRDCGPQIDEVARRMGDGVRAIRAAYQEHQEAGEKKTVTEQTPN